MTVVSDTSPLNYLILIDLSHLLPTLFDQILIPDAVRHELLSAAAPPAVRTWMAAAPPWLAVRLISSVSIPADLRSLHRGEREALLLAESSDARLILLDERQARRVAHQRGLAVSGTLRILDRLAEQRLIDLPDALDRLSQTTFRASPRLLHQIRQRDTDRRQQP
ncbi:MAG TPA: hypothetical protein VJM31_00680 [Vicinamibacterales bacterium]|nr:hypothetical protein [Vicinamibacterales bacterium]